MNYSRAGENWICGAPRRRAAKMLGERFIERTAAKSTIERLVASASAAARVGQLSARGWQVEMLEYREQRLVMTWPPG